MPETPDRDAWFFLALGFVVFAIAVTLAIRY